jgi:hypothetical protein
VRGTCDKEILRRVIRAHVNEVRYCYERSLQTRPELNGRVLSRFTVEPTGFVSASTVAASTVPDVAVGQCVATAIRRWQFPSCTGEINYPFVFVPAGR